MTRSVTAYELDVVAGTIQDIGKEAQKGFIRCGIDWRRGDFDA